jgi:subtilisin family serine protease
LLVLAIAGFATASGAVATAAPPEGNIVGADSPNAIPNSYIVVLKSKAGADVAGKARDLTTRFSGKVNRTYGSALRGFAASMSSTQARRMAAHADVDFVQQNQIIRLDATQNNPPSWGLDRIDQRDLPLDNSYTYSTTASNVHAYVIDSGIRVSHSDFGGRATAGTDTITPGGNANDCDGHGTHVAGTIGGNAHGVAKGVSLVAVRVLDCNGSGSTETVVAGVDWVTQNAIKPAVANMSLGGGGDSALDAAVNNSIASGVTYTLSAGNSSQSACDFSPARVFNGITVGATDINDNRASFSNYGSCVDIFAPGVNITSNAIGSNSATAVLSGTSMAAPHVAGAAALVLADNPTFTPSQVTSSLTSKASPSLVVNRGPGSPNLLLYTGADPTPPPAANNFDITATPNAGVTTPNRSVTTTVATTNESGSQTVTMSAVGLPAGVTASFSPASFSSGGATTATFSASGSAAPGRYPVAITATGSTITHAATYTLVITDNEGSFYQLAPTRILDTRIGNGAPTAPLGQGATIGLQVTGRGGVPATGVSSVVLNVTATGATAASFVTVWPAGVSRPTASSLNLVSGWTGANSVTVAVGAGGVVNIYNNAGSTHMIADVVGFYAIDDSVVTTNGVGGEYQPVTPERLFDSRIDWPGKVEGGGGVRIPVSYGSSVDSHIRALVVNVTAVDPSGDGYLATWNGSGLPPNASTLNYTARVPAVPNMAVVPVSLCCGGFPSIGVYTLVDSHIIVDILGFFDDSSLGGGLRFTPQTPVRIADTRIGQGAPSALGAGTTAAITAPGAVAPAGTEALALNVTAVSPTRDTYVSVWPKGISGIGQPNVSTLNPRPGQIVPNAVYTLVGPTKAFNVYNNAGVTHIVVDVVGTFWSPSLAASAMGKQAPLSGQLTWRTTGRLQAVQTG